MRRTRLERHRKKRSGWKHPLDINRNRRRCAKRRHSANVRARRALQAMQARETVTELIEARVLVAVALHPAIVAGRVDRRLPERRPATRLEPRRAW
jgi:hypothetical protein